MTKYLHARFFAILVGVLFLGTTLQAEEEDWLENYYKNPTPERFVEQMKDWAADGTLDNEMAKPAVIAFISQVLRQNRKEIEPWYAALSGLSPSQMQVLHTAMLFSRTSEADRIMRKAFGKKYDEQKVDTKKILEMPLDKQNTIDMLWGFFYATGSEQAVGRVILGFSFLDAPDDPGGVDIPQGYLPLYKSLPIVAFNSLLANAERHPRVVEILEKLHEEGDLSAREKEGVYDVLSEIDPKGYPPVDRENDKA
ncbi:MAG: hypothetical protein CMO55_25555 [Verrucomicrobiales bacterium]|nr:hypothetical protein [Verrucomicrobiales bacterium]